MIAYRAARDWAAEHRYQQPDDRMVDAVLAALFDACEVRGAYGTRYSSEAGSWECRADSAEQALSDVRSADGRIAAEAFTWLVIETPPEPINT